MTDKNSFKKILPITLALMILFTMAVEMRSASATSPELDDSLALRVSGQQNRELDEISVPMASAAASGHYTIKVTWSAVDEADGYEVWRSTQKNGTYQNVFSTKQPGTISYTNSGLAANKTYYYKVRAVQIVDSSSVFSEFSSTVSAITAYPAGTASVSITGSQDLAPGAVYTYKYTLNVVGAAAANANIGVGGVFEKVSGGTGLFYDTIPQNTTNSVPGSITVRVKPDALPGEEGTIFVKENESTCVTLVTGSGGSIDQVVTPVTGSFTAAVAEPPSAPTEISAVPAGFNAIKVSWSAVPGVGGYEVYCGTSKNGTYSKVYTATSGQLSYTHSGRTWDKTYYYKVRAYKALGSAKLYSSDSTTCSSQPGAVPPGNSLAATSYTAIRVYWTAVPGASGYEVWQATQKFGTYSRKYTSASGNAGSYTKSSLTTDKAYYFKVRSFLTVNGEKIYSDYSSINSTAPGRPSMSVTRASSTSSKISWYTVSGSAGYEVWRSTQKNGTYALKYSGSSSVSSWTNKNLTTGKAYYYKVRAYRNVSGKKVYGQFSSINSVIP